MFRFHSLQFAWVKTFIWTCMVLFLTSTVPAVRSASTTTVAPVLYVPLIYLPHPQLVGRVTYNGGPVNGQLLSLWFYNGSSWSSIVTTTTNSNGQYAFTSPPTLAPGQKYVVEYYNDSNPNRLFYWDTQTLTSYAAGTFIHIGDFDVVNITLTDPTSGAQVNLPRTFRWTQRTGQTTDSYIYTLFDNAGGGLPYFETAPLGYVGSHQVTSLPGSFSLNGWYTWSVDVTRYDGARGSAFWIYHVSFSSTPVAAGALPVAQVELAAHHTGRFGIGPLAVWANSGAQK